MSVQVWLVSFVVLCPLASPLTWASSGRPTQDLPPLPEEAQQCVLCHEANGDTGAVTVPRLAGLSAAYIEKELRAFRSRQRHNDEAKFFMWHVAAALTEQGIRVVSAYFSGISPVSSYGVPGDPEVLRQGSYYYKNGIPAKGVMACAWCHGREGEGAFGPRLAGQRGFYMSYQFKAFKANQRKEATSMPIVVENMTAEEMNAIITYLESQ